MNTSRLDHTDLCILNLLQQDARLSTKELAAKVRMSVSPVYDRVKRLKEQGYIKCYTALLNRDKINQGLVAFIQVQLYDHSANCLKQFQETVNKFDEVRECYHMTGQYDFNLKIAVKDMQTYKIFLVENLAVIPNLMHLQSYFIISECKFETSIKLELL
ncbi:Lrp/AsnC family transcriptional regulator [Pedobacter sp.]|jgi:Lrp/AsnC family leucine-responsive transcriptional regulator|uniref:Lrp/AsnC family transcriptional regulator n=1 Tax=Pedobacter sp. TaxID=1411316 RepID=UPI002C5CED55|nr:Lrp/AsnC family transcriptional regulator [Pedobacter sp.]HWW42864.1 Lrp/AsnC family transcriptional regulator [Pedobacter sp.]